MSLLRGLKAQPARWVPQHCVEVATAPLEVGARKPTALIAIAASTTDPPFFNILIPTSVPRLADARWLPPRYVRTLPSVSRSLRRMADLLRVRPDILIGWQRRAEWRLGFDGLRRGHPRGGLGLLTLHQSSAVREPSSLWQLGRCFNTDRSDP